MRCFRKLAVAAIVMVAAVSSASAVEIPAALINALIRVESRGNAAAIGDAGKAVGILQIHRIYVRDVNNILGRRKYSYEDRKDPSKSVCMTVVYLKHYGRSYERQTGNPATFEVLARIHNGGPEGWRKPATKTYWLKVKKELSR